MPTAISMRAAIALNTKTDALLRRLGINAGPLTKANHVTTAKIIDHEACVPDLLAVLQSTLDLLETSGGFTTVSKQDIEVGIAALRGGLDAALGGTFSPRVDLIQWHYVTEKLPDDDTAILIACHSSGQPGEAVHDNGVFLHAGSDIVIPDVYAWADLPEIPQPKGGA
jgi:hypothetical protein